jgi:glycosyltransferase-like protein
MRPPLRIAILAHSTNPRGGVVHALALGDALTELGHQVVVHAPDAADRGFFRPTLCETRCIPASRTVPGTLALVKARIADYLDHFELPGARDFDVFHAQDGISGNALATLVSRGLIVGFVRTVHHIDRFEDPELDALQRRSIVAAQGHAVVSAFWAEALRKEFGLAATVVGNGVDLARFSPAPEPGDLSLRRRLTLDHGPVYLAIGGVEERKNTIGILQAFAQVHAWRSDAQLVIAGGASLLDHGGYQARFAALAADLKLPESAMRRIGPVADADMPALYRNADVLVFPSLKEGFGLVVLEAMASGVPVVLARQRPFTDLFGTDDVLWCDPDSTGSIADAMVLAANPTVRRTLAARGRTVAPRFGWSAVARNHLSLYADQRALTDA